MGVYHDFYTEAKINGKWQWIDPMGYNSKDPTERTYALWGKSWLRATYDKIESDGYDVAEKDLSTELAARLYKSYHEHENDKTSLGLYKPRLVAISENTIRNLLLALGGYEHAAYVEKEDIKRFKTGELDDIYNYIFAEEYRSLPEKAQFGYDFYEWDSPDGWVEGFKILQQILAVRKRDICNADFHIEIEDLRFIVEQG